GTKDGHCTDALSWTVGSTGAYRLTWLRFPSAPKYHGVGSSDYHRMLRCPGVGSSGAPESKSFQGGPLGLATPIFSISLSSLEPKSLRIVILTIILVQVLCCHSITKITRNGINGAIFVTDIHLPCKQP